MSAPAQEVRRSPIQDVHKPGPHATSKTTRAYPVKVGAPIAHGNGVLSTSTPSSPARTRFQNAVRAVLRNNGAYGGEGLPRHINGTTMLPSTVSSNGTETDIDMQQASCAPTLAAKLRGLQPGEPVPAHSALVRHLQFSPNGKLLATSSWDRTSVISQAVSQAQAASPFTPYRTLAHPSGFVSQVAWSPSGALLLTKLPRSVEVWSEVWSEVRA